MKHCEWDEWTINQAAIKGNLEMLKYCFSNNCPCDKEESCKLAAKGGHLDCVRFLFDKVKPSRETEKEAVIQAAAYGHLDILKYFFEERKIPDVVKIACVGIAARFGKLDCLKYLVEEAKVPLNYWVHISLPLVTTNTLTAKTTCSKKGAQNQRTKNTLDLSRQQKKQKREKDKQLLENSRWIIEREKERERHLCFVFWTKT